jgi:hypothetical protein
LPSCPNTFTQQRRVWGNPTAWRVDEGLITLDLENMASRAQEHARQLGSQPKVIPVFVSVGGGHTELGLIAHQELKKDGAFQNSLYLPVVIIPADPTQYGWTWEYSWEWFCCKKGVTLERGYCSLELGSVRQPVQTGC